MKVMPKWALLLGTALFLAGCCSVPSFQPDFWNDGGQTQSGNNCYNYANNKRTNTFAQPGEASGTPHPFPPTCATTTAAANGDGIDSIAADETCPVCNTRIALVIWPGVDYHWYRRDANGTWSHKPGGTMATNVDNSGQTITDPQTADRGNYTIFCGFFCSCSSCVEGAGHEDIK